MPWPRASQRVLIVFAAALLAFAVVGGKTSLRPTAVAVPDDPSLTVLLDLNSATAEEFESLPGVGTSLAGRIDAYRKAHGPFRSVDDLRQVPGLGEKLVATLRPFVTVR